MTQKPGLNKFSYNVGHKQDPGHDERNLARNEDVFRLALLPFQDAVDSRAKDMIGAVGLNRGVQLALRISEPRNSSGSV